MENIDAITGEIIPEDYKILLVENNCKYFFDVRTLYKHFLYKGVYENPYTRNKIDDCAIEQINKILKTLEIPIRYTYKFTSTIYTIRLVNEINFGDALIEIYRKEGILNKLPDITVGFGDIEVFDNLETPIKEFDTNRIICFDEIRTTYDRYNVNVSWYRYLNHGNVLVELIDRKYYIDEANEEKPNENDFKCLYTIIHALLDYDSDLLYRNINFRDFILSITRNMRISYENAKELINCAILDEYIQHALYSIVVDKYKCNKYDGIESLYARPKKVTSDFKLYIPSKIHQIFSNIFNITEFMETGPLLSL